MEAPLISAALIVKNEERFLGDCLQSLAGFADEVIVVDTGSTDRSVQIAHEHGAAVDLFPWTDDFSAARNRALELAHGRWILYIDADERVAGGVENARRRMQDPDYIGFQVLLAPWKGATSYWVLRLFRNHPLVRFRGIIHENIWPALTEYQGVYGGRVGYLRLQLDHFGYEDSKPRKNQRNLPLLQRALKEDPERIYSWCHLGEIRLDMGDEEGAVQAWRRALEIARSRAQPLADDSLPWSDLIGYELKRQGDAAELLEEALSRFPHNLQFHWLQGQSLMDRGEFEKAIPFLETLARAGESGAFSRTAAYDLRMLGVLPYECLATCYFRLARWADAARYYEAALRLEPDRIDLRAKRALAANKAKI